MITSIELRNWKTHKETRLDFSKGTNVLVGLMGAGKSSIMDAISYSLFGTFPSIHHKRVSVNDLIMSRPRQESSASVKLTFTLDADEYIVERTISMSEGTKATLQKNGQYLQSQPVRVNEEIARILKVDYDLFSRAIYSEQNKLDYFLELRSGERKKQLDELLGLDKFAIAQENATGLLNRIKETISEHEKMIASFDLSKLNDELKVHEKEIGELHAKKSSLEKEHERTTSELKGIESNLKLSKEQLQKKISIAKEIAELKSKLDFIRSEVSKLEKESLPRKDEIEGAIKQISAQISEIKSKEQLSTEQERKATRALSDIEAAIKQINQKIAERDKLTLEQKDKNLKSHEEELLKISNALHELEKNLAGAQSQRDETKKWMGELEKHISKCPVCERDLDAHMLSKLMELKKSTLDSANLLIKSSEVEIKEKRLQIEALNKEIDKLRLVQAKLKEHSGIDSQLEQNIQLQKGAKESVDISRLQSEKLRKEHEGLVAKLADTNSWMEKVQRLELYRKQITEIDQNHARKSEEFESIGVDEAAVEKLQKSFVNISSLQSKVASEMVAHIRYISDKQKLIDEKNAQILQINKLLSEIGAKKVAVDNLAKFKNALELTQHEMRSKLVSSINNVMQEIWPSLYPYSDYSAIMLDAKSNDYILKVRTSVSGLQKWEDVDGIASGGERSIACLAMRVAFALVLVPNLKWIILDEPTHNIDEQGMSRFITVFNETLPRIIDQIFIITHDEQLKQASSSKTYLLTRNKAEGGATVIQEH